MPVRTLLVTALACCVLALGADAAVAQAPGCTLVVSQDTTLDRDVTCSGVAIEIAAPGISLDLAGHSVGGSDYGIRNLGHDRVTIKNGRVGGDLGGILVEGAERNTIRDLTATSGLGSSIRLVNADHGQIRSVESRGYEDGISLREGSDDNLIKNSLEAGTLYGGMRIVDSDDNRIVGNAFRADEQIALALRRAHDNHVEHNDFAVASNSAISVWEANANIIHRNEIVFGTPQDLPEVDKRVGIAIRGSNHTRVVHNRVIAAEVGLHVLSGARTNLARNRVADSLGDGVLVEAPAGLTWLTANRSRKNGDDGIDVETKAGRLRRNVANGNASYGIEAVSGVFARGNRADGNGAAAQCLNVFCR